MHIKESYMNRNEIFEIIDVTLDEQLKMIDDEIVKVEETNNKVQNLIISNREDNTYVKGIRKDNNNRIENLKKSVKDAEAKVLETVFGDIRPKLESYQTVCEEASSTADKLSKDFEKQLAEERVEFIQDVIKRTLKGYKFKSTDEVIDKLFGRVGSTFLGMSKSDGQVETEILNIFENIMEDLGTLEIGFDEYYAHDFNPTKYALSLKGDEEKVETIGVKEIMSKKIKKGARKTFQDIHDELSAQLVANLEQAGLDKSQMRSLINKIGV